MKLHFTPRAARDIAEIADNIRERRPRFACGPRFLNRCRVWFRFPHIGRRQKVEGVRKLVTRRYPYLVYYTADDEAEEIVVLAIQHAAREREHSDV
jgi:plasmid stabilization system protein ParE